MSRSPEDHMLYSINMFGIRSNQKSFSLKGKESGRGLIPQHYPTFLGKDRHELHMFSRVKTYHPLRQSDFYVTNVDHFWNKTLAITSSRIHNSSCKTVTLQNFVVDRTKSYSATHRSDNKKFQESHSSAALSR